MNLVTNHAISDDPSKRSWSATVLTLFPEMFPGPLGYSVAGHALKHATWDLETINIRSFAKNKYGSVDSHPYGGGPGMIMRADILASALDSVISGKNPNRVSKKPIIYLSPRGKPLNQVTVKKIAAGPGIILLCGRFEGIDERLIESRNIQEISVGDYILSGGEIAALALMDACVRLLPGVIGTNDCLKEESFENDLLEYPQYTYPRSFEGKEVPSVLLSGNHKNISKWRLAEAKKVTQDRRSDLWNRNYSESLNMRVK
jgi:tRNA (guanine37-N1)-methyltransferase